jgi:hypothetical protein
VCVNTTTATLPYPSIITCFVCMARNKLFETTLCFVVVVAENILLETTTTTATTTAGMRYTLCLSAC